MYRVIPRRFLLLGLTVFLAASPVLGTHFRGGNVNAQVTADGVATLTYEALWRKGGAFFPFDGVDVIRLYDPANVGRTSPLRTVFVSIGGTTVFRDVSDPAFDFRIQVIQIDLSALGLPQGSYVARFEDCCRIRGIQNAPESTYSLEALIIYDGTDNGSPILNSRILTVVGKGLPYDQNLNAFDPDGRPLTYQWLIGSGHPTRGPTFNVPGITLDGGGQIFISPFDTANLVDFNPFNPAGDYVFKVRVTDADGAFSDRDVLLDVVATANLPPAIAPIGNRVIDVGESLVLPITATDPNVVDTVTLDTSVLPDNTVLVKTPGNPASGTLAFRPDAGQVGVFGINVEAEDDGTPILTDSELVTITVLDPANGCPVLSPLGNFDLTPGESLSITLSGADPDAGQSLAFAASFLPPGASFDPATATFSWTPTAADAGVHQGTVFEVRDSSVPPCADLEVVGFSVQPANRFPVLDPIGERSVTEGAMVFFTVSGSDPDAGALVFSAQPLPTGASFDPSTREFMWTPTIGQAGVYEVTFRAADAGTPSLSDSETVRITVAADGAEAVRLLGVAEEQVVAGRILVEARAVSPFDVISVAFAIDGVEINADASVPYFLGGEQDGQPLGFDTSTLADGLHVIEATALDSAGGTVTAQRKVVVRNFVPPVVDDVDGLFDGAVVTGTIDVEIEASDDQQVTSVEFLIDGESVNTETGVRYFLGGGRLPEGTFDVSCTVCLQAGDLDDDLVVVAVDEDGTLAALCAAGNLTGVAAKGNGNGNGTPDGEPPADEDVCDVFRGVNGPAFGLCNAFCEAQDCDGPGYRQAPCEQLRSNFIERAGESRFPCEAGGECIQALTLGWVEDPSRLATFGPEDFNGAQTRFQLPFEVPLGFDTTALENGEHTLTVIVTDNTGLETLVEIVFLVDNAPPPADALKVTIVEPAAGATFEAGRVLPFAAAVADAQGPVTVRFYAASDLVVEDAVAPFETAVLVPAGSSRLVLQAIAEDDRGPRAAVPVVLTVAPRPVEPEPIEVVAVSADRVREGRVAVDSGLRATFSRPIDAAAVDSGIRLFANGVEVPLDTTVDADGVTALATPFTALEPDTLHLLVIDGVESIDGARAPRFAHRFITFPDVAIVIGQVLDADFNPLAGLQVAIGEVTATTDDNGAFRLDGAPAGEQSLEVAGGTVAGRTYPPLAFPLTIETGVRSNGLEQPIMLVALDLDGGLDIVGGTAAGGSVLTSSQLPGVSIDLSGVTVLDHDGVAFNGRMSITPVPSHAVPMELPDAVIDGVGTSLYVTVQPGSLQLVPPAPIVYPNPDGAIAGEQVSLVHFDHDVEDWVVYGTGTVTADGTRIVSDPGVGLPKTGWGAPLPPATYTDVEGRVVDIEDSPLHGVMVSSGNRRSVTDQDGTFTLRRVFAGREGTPRELGVIAIARDVNIRRFFGLSQIVVANQNGTTNVGDVEIRNYAPIVDGKIHLHGDYRPLGGQDHVLERGSMHAGEQRYRREVEEVQRRLQEMGFRQGGGPGDNGRPIEVDGGYGLASTRAMLVFQGLELANGANGTPVGCGLCTGKVDRDTLDEINEIPPAVRIWENVGATSVLDHPCPNEPGDGWGTPDLGDYLFAANLHPQAIFLGAIPTNDVSLPDGRRFPPHGSHRMGIDVDIPLPRINLQGGCGGWGGGVVIDHPAAGAAYDRAAARAMLRAWLLQGAATDLIYLGDRQLCDMEALCTYDRGHRNHFHVRIDPRAAPGPANDFGKADKLDQPTVISSLGAAGATDSDVPVDATVLLSFARPFDPATLNAATVQLSDADGLIQATVAADDGGWTVSLTPAEVLAFGSDYEVTVTSGAVFATGDLLAEPAMRGFTTEATPSLRVAAVSPAEGSEPVPVDSRPSIRFDGPVDASTLGPGSVTLIDLDQNLEVLVALGLSDDATVLTLEPLTPLADVNFFSLSLSGDVRGADGSPLVAEQPLTTFPTSLPPGLETVEVEPAEVVITRADLSDRFLAVTGFFADGTVRDLSVQEDSGTIYAVDPVRIIARVAPDGRLEPTGNGDAIVNVIPLLEGFEAAVRLRVVGVFPDVRVLGRQFDLREDDDVVLEFSEPVDVAPLAVRNVDLVDGGGNPVAGTSDLSADGLSLTFDPAGLLPLRNTFSLRFDLDVTDDNGFTRTFPRTIPLATAAANGGFELGDLSGYAAEGDVEVVELFGPLAAPEGQFMAKMTNGDLAVDGRFSRLDALDLEVPPGAQELVLTYNFFTDEIEQGQPFNDFFRVTLVMADGSSQTVIEVDRDDLRFSGFSSPVPGFDRMTGFRSASVDVSSSSGLSCHLVLEMEVEDAGDASIDSAVLVDDIHFE